jgi:hypothetical protein
LHHLKQTLPQNIADNASYPSLEFIILDYNSGDGLKEWITTAMADHLATGRVVYIHSPGHEYFQRSHSRNMAFNAAKGELLCNVDADNYTGPGFAKYIGERFSADPKIFLTAFSADQPNSPDFFGRICCKKEDLIRVGGYNEQMDGYGFEDHELIHKLSAAGLRREVMTEPDFFKAITHGDDERIREEKTFRALKQVYLSLVSPSRSDILYLFKDGTCAGGRLVDRSTDNSASPDNTLYPKKYRYEYALTTAEWQPGQWLEREGKLHVTDASGKAVVYAMVGDLLSSGDREFQKVADEKLLTDLLMFYTQFTNRRFLNDDTVEIVPPPASAENDSHRILTSSLYWPAREWHWVLGGVLQPLFQTLAELDKNGFGVLRFSNYRGPNISITWFLPYLQAETLLSLMDRQLRQEVSELPKPMQNTTYRSHSTFADVAPGQLAYGLYQYPAINGKALDPPALIFLSRQLTDVVLATVASEPIDQDTTFTLAFYLHVLAIKPLGIPDTDIIKKPIKEDTQNQGNLAAILTDNAGLFSEILNDLASPGYLDAAENQWMMNWQNACAAVAREVSMEKQMIMSDVSTLIIDTLGLPLQAQELIFSAICKATAYNGQ